MALILGLLAISLSANPGSLVLGKDTGANLEIHAPSDAKLTLSANVGSVSAPKQDGDVFRAHYTPPSIKSPSVALVLAISERGGDRELGWLAIPLTGADTMEIQTRAGSKVEANVAGKTMGPVTADNGGIARIYMVVPPGVQKAVLHITDPLGNSTQKPLNLDPPPFSRMRMAPRESGGGQIDLEVFVVRPDGAPDDDAKLDLKSGEGEFEVRRRVGPGTYLVRYTAPAGKTGTTHLEARTNGGRTTLELPVVGAGPRPAAASGALWRSTLNSRSPWSVSAGVIGGGGATFDGAGGGTVLGEVAVRLKDLPIEAVLDGGAAWFGEYTQYGATPTNAERVRSQSQQIDLGARVGVQLTDRLDGHLTLLVGAQRQAISRTLPNQSVLSNDAWTPKFAAALGANLILGPGRVLAQVVADSSPSGTAGLGGSLASVQLMAGYLVTIR